MAKGAVGTWPNPFRSDRSPLSVPEAIKKAEHYRLLNDPEQAESICLDILEVDPDNQEALVTLILALTDQFGVTEPPPTVAQVAGVRRPPRAEYQRQLLHGDHLPSGGRGRSSGGRWGAHSPSRRSARR